MLITKKIGAKCFDVLQPTTYGNKNDKYKDNI